MTKDKTAKVLFVLVSVTSIGTMLAFTPQKGNPYQEEFKALRQNSIYSSMFNRRSNISAKTLLANIESAQQVGLFGRILRGKLIIDSPVAISEQMMPHLYGYVRDLCNLLEMKMPTIYLTRNKTGLLGFANDSTSSIKVATSAGALLIGQDLLLQVSPKALEAAVAYELNSIGNNHWNKNWLVSWVAPGIVTFALPAQSGLSRLRNQALSYSIAWFLLGKRFEKQSDRFVYQTLNNAEGFIELCSFWQQKEQNVDAEYNDVYTHLSQANLSLFDTVTNGIGYFIFRTGHRLNKLGRWIVRSTPLSGKQKYQSRIDAAKRYLESKASN